MTNFFTATHFVAELQLNLNITHVLLKCIVKFFNLHHSANPDGEAEAADAPARRRQGAKGEPGPSRAAGRRHHGVPPGRGEFGRLPLFREDEVGSHHRAAQTGGQDQAG